MWYVCIAAASIHPSPTQAALAADTWWLGWVLVAFAGEDQRVHSRIPKLSETNYPIPLCYSGPENTAALSLHSTSDAESGA